MKKIRFLYTLEVVTDGKNYEETVAEFQPPDQTGKNAAEELQTLIQLIQEGQIKVASITVE